MKAVGVLAAHELVKALRLRHIQRVQYQRIHDTKDHGVGANRQRKGRDRGHGESGRLAQQAQAVTDILDQRLDQISAERFVAFLSVPLAAAELDASTALRCGAIQAGALQIISAMLDVSPELLLHFFLDSRAMKDLGGKRAKVGEEFHDSSGCAARAEAMASARRFHPSTSSRKRLR